MSVEAFAAANAGRVIVIGLGAGDRWIDTKPDDAVMDTDPNTRAAWQSSPKGFVETWGGAPTMLWELSSSLWSRYGHARQSDFVLLDSDGTVMAPGGPMAWQEAPAQGLLEYHFPSD